MAAGLKRYRARKEAVASLGRILARRSKSKCELCGVSGESLSVLEVEPLPEEPEVERSIFACNPCRAGVEGERLDPVRWRFLETVVWSEIPAVQVTAVRLCRQLQDEGVDWATDIHAHLYLSPEIEAWLS